ncbi:MAG: uracil-DNA glycosylase family protein [Bacillota bacterium]
MRTFADKVLEFNQTLDFKGKLPEGIRIMNPFKEDPKITAISATFYNKYYNDCHTRRLILGINPGRFGAGVTGVPFTDTKRLADRCGIKYSGKETHELSSVFVYEVIDAYGGVEKFYKDFYINSICPLGFTISDAKGDEKNYNYYDSKELTNAVAAFMVDSLKKQIGFGIQTDICYCLGTGKNERFLRSINSSNGLFKEIIPLEHPRFIMQYKSKLKQQYIDKYIKALRKEI